ncbi:MAG TPA: ribonuclease E/G, partial [Rhodospirillales bacterium]|nr:ribonuclease E/G [Rhodospirillales bacterium]
MPSRTMLIDASHPEETRVVVVDGNRVEDYDVEVASRRQLKGNIYLAKVTRVEPSLQAAFVDYGGNRHGFLAFNEIHPDYYQIPVADRERLLAEQAAEIVDRDDDGDGEAAEAVGDDDEEVERRRPRPPSRFYKIQEVIKRRQIMLVQVTKEERGNKGAALTTYLSLAGRYCVLMPNTARGGGISRKIATATDRKRLKKMLGELEVPDGMAVIVRTAGAGRSKAEIKRDYEYLVRLWSSIRETTLQSTAPTLVYEEANLIKRSIRDLYGRDIEEIIVQGDEEYRVSKEFMKLFITSHAKRVKQYEDTETPLFQKFGVEDQLASMHQPTVQLRSGGYIVINPTEALVAIDVNSGRSTRERNIEETALRTNLEAADEIARQLRLRDMAGLIVIDFIDMENARNQGMVERRIKDAMKNDRARVQLGRISPFGLLELSRQRLRPSLIETSFEVCPACGGNGLRRTTESTALAILRKLEEEGLRRRSSEVSITVSPAVALYLLNQKRRSLLAIEDRYGMRVNVLEDATLVPPDHRLERLKPYDARTAEEVAEVAEEAPAEAEEVMERAEPAAAEREDADAGRGRRRRPRRRRRGEEELPGREDRVQTLEAEEGADEDAEAEAEAESDEEAETGGEVEAARPDEPSEQPGRKRRRRGKRGGRRRARVETGDLGAQEFEGYPSAERLDFEAADDAMTTTERRDAALAAAVMDDDGAPPWEGGDVAAPAPALAEAAMPDEAAMPNEAAVAAEAEAGEGPAPIDTGDAAEAGAATPRPRRRSPRRSRAKPAVEAAAAATGEAAEPAELPLFAVEEPASVPSAPVEAV